MKKTLLIFCTLFFISTLYSIHNCNAQTDTTQVKFHNPKKASCLSLIPGAGQIYNKKYWKLPIVYGGLGVTCYLIYYYGSLTSMYRREYVARENPDNKWGYKENPNLAGILTGNILLFRNTYRRDMEISIAACAIVYFLNILDASVDAHLYYYDVSDNLTLGVKPVINMNTINGGITPCMAFIVKF